MKTTVNRALFWLMEACYFVAYYYQTPIQLSYILTFGVSGSVLGIISSLSSFVSVIVIPLVPTLTRKFGVKKVFCLGFVLQILFFGSYLFARNVIIIAIANIINGVAFGITMVLMASAVVSIYPQEKSGAVISLYTMLQALAQATATSAGIYVSNLTGYRNNYIVSTLLSFACLAFCFALSGLEHKPEPAVSAAPAEKGRPRPMLIPLLLLCAFCGVIMSVVQGYTEPFARYTGHTAGLEFYFTVFAGGMAVIRLFLAATIKRLTVRKATLLLSPAVALGMLLMNIQTGAAPLLIGAAFTAIGIGCLQTLAQFRVFQCYPPQSRERASSIFYFGFYGGMIAGNFSGGYLFEGWTQSLFFLFYAAISLLPAACCLVPLGKKNTPITQ